MSEECEDKKPRVATAQHDCLCDFFEENPEVVRGYKKTPKYVNAVRLKWKKITPKLNALGPPRDRKAWAKYLCNVKAKLKRKKIKWRQKSDGSGPLICNADEFCPIELRMLQILKNEYEENEDEGRGEDEEYNMPLSDIASTTTKEELNGINNPHHKIELNASESQASIFVNQNEYGDEFDFFARNVAMQLRTLPLPIALETQELLLSTLKKQRLKVTNADLPINGQ